MLIILDNNYAQVTELKDYMDDFALATIREVCSFTHTDFMYRWTCLTCEKPVKWVDKKPFCSVCNKQRNFREVRKMNKPTFTKLCYFKNNEFPTGLFRRVADGLLKNNIKFNWADARDKVILTKKWVTAKPIELRYYQKECADTLILKTRGIACKPTRSGKTYVIAEIIRRLGLQSLIIVPNLNLLHQTHTLLKEYFKSNDVGIIGDSVYAPNNITVSTIQTLHSRIDTAPVQFLLNSTECLIIDEAHHINFSSKNGEHSEYNTWMNICMKIPAYYRFGFTATPGKSGDLDRALLEGTTGSIQYKIELAKLVKEGYILQPKVFVYKYIPKKVTWTTWQQADKQGVIINKDRCKFIATLAKEYVKDGKSLLILVDKIAHADNIRTYLPESLYLDGKDKTEKRAEIIAKFENNKGILVSTLFKEGVTIIFNGLLIAASFSKERRVIQTCGRVLNVAGGTGEIIDIHDMDGSTLENRYKLRKRVYKKEGFIIKERECQLP